MNSARRYRARCRRDAHYSAWRFGAAGMTSSAPTPTPAGCSTTSGSARSSTSACSAPFSFLALFLVVLRPLRPACEDGSLARRPGCCAEGAVASAVLDRLCGRHVDLRCARLRSGDAPPLGCCSPWAQVRRSGCSVPANEGSSDHPTSARPARAHARTRSRWPRRASQSTAWLRR